jgi:thiol:disulfide interchange protein
LGGLILNLMPCVLPVISLKLLSFIEQGGQSRRHVFTLNLWYAAGLMSVFLVLAILSASFSLAWGEQFTHTWFKITLTALVFVMALSFLGVWEIPIPGFAGSGTAGRLQVQEGAAGAFSKGVFTTILATPCAGPFLGPVMGFMLDQPPHICFLVFGSVGLGMASPYLIIGAFPELISFLPKPGAWMETVQQVMGFLLLGTVVYLFTTMTERYFIPTLTLLVGLWFACWLIGRTPITASEQKRKAAWIGGAATAALVGLFAFTFLLEDLKLPWRPFSPDALAQARREGKTVMVDFTADWCPNCKWNLAWAIDTKKVHQLVEKNDIVPMIADWTDHSPVIKQVLTQTLRRQTIPVLAIWPADSPDDGVIILDDLLTEGDVLEALERAGPSRPPGPAAQTTITMEPSPPAS